MQYETLDTEKMADLLRNHLTQAESDHFVHTLQAEEADATLAAIDDKNGDEALVIMAQAAQLRTHASVAEKKAEHVKVRLADLGAPVVKPDPTPVDALPAEVAVER